jgi:mannosyltransferase OCH1-like enzyme
MHGASLLESEIRMPISKTLHIIWIGDESKRPDALIETWQRMNPLFRVKIWGNQDLAGGRWHLVPEIRAWLARELCGVADLMRWEILYRFGGVAVDADSSCVRPLEDWLLEPECFAVWESEIARPGLICNNALGSIAGHPLIGQIITDIRQDTSLMQGMAWEKLGPARITNTVRSHRYTDITVYPSHYFIPEHFSGLRYKGSGPVFARQEWGSTLQSYGRIGKKLPEETLSGSR